MNDKVLGQSDERRAEMLRIFDGLPPKGRQTFLNLARLLAHCPGFKEAIREATPDGQAVPPVDVTERLVAEWMGKEALARSSAQMPEEERDTGCLPAMIGPITNTGGGRCPPPFERSR